MSNNPTSNLTIPPLQVSPCQLTALIDSTRENVIKELTTIHRAEIMSLKTSHEREISELKAETQEPSEELDRKDIQMEVYEQDAFHDRVRIWNLEVQLVALAADIGKMASEDTGLRLGVKRFGEELESERAKRRCIEVEESTIRDSSAGT